MLTSPVNVTSPISTNLKPHASSTDIGAGHSPVVAGALVRPAAIADPDTAAPAPSLLATVNAVAATAGGRTVLQSLAFSVATLLNISRRTDEQLTALFLRIATAIDALPAGDRQQIEIRAGLKALKIALMDLPTALRNPDGPFAARLTAMAEAPQAKPGQTSANAASTAYLQQGTNSGHTEETLAMRAAARNNAAGLGLFSPEARQAAQAPVDAKVLQSQLKTMFEPNAVAARSTTPEGVVANAEKASSSSKANGTNVPVATGRNETITTPLASATSNTRTPEAQLAMRWVGSTSLCWSKGAQPSCTVVG